MDNLGLGDAMSSGSQEFDNLSALGERLEAALHLASPPIAIGFSDERPEGLKSFDNAAPEPMSDGRSGRVPAGCVFWIKASDDSFTTEPADHGNCSVGSFTHGLVDFNGIASNSDVAALLGSGWVNEQMVSKIPFIGRRYNFVSYGPLTEAAFAPDVILLRVNARQMMVISDSVELSIEGKPQCHIVAIAKEQKKVAASVGCALSRVRTGMPPYEMTCAIPIDLLNSVVEAIEKTNEIDTVVAKYAANDARRFASLTS